jgi:hypothetical protein
LDLLDSLPRLRLSSDQLKFVLWMLKELDVPGVPSLQTLRDQQEALRARVGISTNRKVALSGNVFYMNSIPSLIALVCSQQYNPSDCG